MELPFILLLITGFLAGLMDAAVGGKTGINTAEGREKFGRENYYFKKENEDIFIIEYDTIK